MRISDLKNLTVLYIGEDIGNSLSRFNYLKVYFSKSINLSFNNLYQSLSGKILYHSFKGIFYKRCSDMVIEYYNKFKPDIVWIEMGMEIDNKVIEYIKLNNTFIVNTYSDGFTSTITHRYSENYNKSIPYFDIVFTPRESDYPLYKSYGAKKVIKFWKGFDPDNISCIKKPILTLDFIFAGHKEDNRLTDLKYVVERLELGYKIFGGGWNKSGLKNTYPSLSFIKYGSVFEEAKIGINYFSKWHNDTQNSRLFEIPASGTFMLCEESSDALECFQSGIEAEFFKSKEELLDKLKFYSKNDIPRNKIAEKGFEKARKNYSNKRRVEQMMEIIASEMSHK